MVVATDLEITDMPAIVSEINQTMGRTIEKSSLLPQVGRYLSGCASAGHPSSRHLPEQGVSIHARVSPSNVRHLLWLCHDSAHSPYPFSKAYKWPSGCTLQCAFATPSSTSRFRDEMKFRYDSTARTQRS